MLDPNPLVNGKGIKKLKSEGIDVQVGILEQDARKINETYIKYMTKKMPVVVLKWAMSLDGKIATRKGNSKWISALPASVTCIRSAAVSKAGWWFR